MFKRLGAFVVGTILAIAQLLIVGAPPVAASAYDNTNPKATPCWDGSHSVILWRNYWIYGSDGIWGRVQLYYSPFCNTVWTQVSNFTGVPDASGVNYGAARVLTADEFIYLYRCPKTTCTRTYAHSSGDVLQPFGHSPRSGWSNQRDLPTGSTINGVLQPPTARAIGRLTTGGTSYTADGKLEPVWTAQSNWFSNKINDRTDSANMSCDNLVDAIGDHRCNNWGESSTGGSRALTYLLDDSLDDSHGVDLAPDMRDVIIPAWNAVSGADNPTFSPCAGVGCVGADVYVYMDDVDYGGNTQCYASTGPGLPLIRYYCSIVIDSTPTYSHGCPDADTGCTPGAFNDPRPLLSHEFGHVQGLGHCDVNAAVMCNWVGTATTCDITLASCHDENWKAIGSMYWHPQQRDVWGLRVVYP